MASSPPAAQLETFFPAESDVRHDIALLSYLLANVKSTQDVGDDARESKKAKSDPLRAWNHLAFILTPGEGSDPLGNRVVAVTGQVENGALTAAVVTRDVLSPPAQTSQFAITQVKSHGKAGRDLLLHYDSTSMCVTDNRSSLARSDSESRAEMSRSPSTFPMSSPS